MSTDLPACVGLLGLLAQASTLKRLPRTGWLLAGVLPCETVADHTAGVALLTLGLAAAINQDWRAVGLEQPLDSGVAVTIAVLHDLAESQVTDLPRRSARLIGAAVKRQAEAAALDEILQPLPGGAAYVALWQEYVDSASPEARLVHDADQLEMVHQALHYERAGHRVLDEFWQGHCWRYRLCEQLYGDLKALRCG